MNYYNIKDMNSPTKEIYGINENKKILLVGTAKKQDWTISVDVNVNSPCDVLANGCNLPFLSSSFDVVILDFVTNFLPKEHMIDKLIKEANRVGKRVVGRCMVTPGKRLTIKGAMVRYTHRNYPFGVDWIGRNA